MVMSERINQTSPKKVEDQKTSLDKQKKLTFHKNVFNRSYYENLTFSWQQKLFTQSSVTLEDLSQASFYLCPVDYTEVLAERNISSLCGYPLCPQLPKEFKSDTHLSVKERKLYDITPLKPFCSNVCFGASRFYEVQLSTEPVYLRDFKKLFPVEAIPLGVPVREYVKNRKPAFSMTEEEKTALQKRFIEKKLQSAGDEVVGSIASLVGDIKLEKQPQNICNSKIDKPLGHTTIEGYSAPLVPSSVKDKDIAPKAQTIKPTNKVSVGEFEEDSDEDSTESSEDSEDDMDEEDINSGLDSVPKLTIFGKLFLLLDHSVTISSKELFEHIKKSQDPTTPHKRFINKVIPRDGNVVLRCDLLSKILLERLRFLMKSLNITVDFCKELMDWIETLDLYEPEMAWLAPAEALCLCMVFLTRLSQCLITDSLSCVSSEKMSKIASDVGFDLEKVQFLSRKL